MFSPLSLFHADLEMGFFVFVAFEFSDVRGQAFTWCRAAQIQERHRCWCHCWHLYCTSVDNRYCHLVCVCLPPSHLQIRPLPHWRKLFLWLFYCWHLCCTDVGYWYCCIVCVCIPPSHLQIRIFLHHQCVSCTL